MSQLLKSTLENYNIYYYKEEYLPLLTKISKGEYTVENLIVDKKTAYIAKIDIDGKKFLYKKLYPQAFRKQFLELFREKLAIELIKKTHRYREQGFCELVDIYGVGVQKKLFGNEQFLLMEYIDGRSIDAINDFKQLESFLIRLHSAKVYHGDAHIFNFIIDEQKNLRVLDTKLKRIYLGNIGGHYDMFKLRDSAQNQSPYPYSKNIIYWYCFLRFQKKELFKKK